MSEEKNNSQDGQVTQLKAPTNITCTEFSETTLTITWDPVENATDYIVFCKDVLSESWENGENTMTSGETQAVVNNLYPTATFEVKVVAVSTNPLFSNSDDSESIYCDTSVGSCTPKEKKCCF